MVTVVTGPPCSGKSTYIRDHAKPGDIVIDMDRIALAISVEGTEHHGYDDNARALARTMREVAVRAVLAAADVVDSWVIDTRPSGDRRRQYAAVRAKVVTIDPGIEVCLQRALTERPAWVQQTIRDYYAA